MTKIITFTNVLKVDEEFNPKPAINFLPEWYKKINSYVNNEKKPDGNGKTTATVKKCIPVFDALTAGYLIFSYTDLYVSKKEGQLWYEWPSTDILTFHTGLETKDYPLSNGMNFPKWVNPWSIKTAPGYSCLFVNPFHRESNFTILPGVVDTDVYTAPVNFPFVMNDTEWEGLIPAGTPIAQVIPFKRDSFKMILGNEYDMQKSQNTINKVRTRFFDSYKNKFWHRKEYK